MSVPKSIVVIPARKNSKRLKGKNTALLNGKPLITHSIEYALKFFNKNNIWVNTDDELIIKIAKTFNINILKRSKELCKDETPTSDVIVSFASFLTDNNIEFDQIITLQPTNPIRPKDLIPLALSSLIKNKRKSLFGVSPLNKKFGIIKNKIFQPSNYIFGQRSQDLNQLYFENGLIYISKKDLLINEKKFLSDDVYPYIIESQGSSVDIDYDFDLKLAELILKKNQ